MSTVLRVDAATFLARGGLFLVAREAENNLALSIAHRVAASAATRASSADAPYFALVVEGDVVVGAAFRTPPFKLVVVAMPPAAVDALVDDVAQVYASLPAVLGPPDETARFAAAWAARTGARVGEGMQQRIHQLDVVTAQERPPPGRARVAVDDDVDLAAAWIDAFAVDAAAQMDDARATASRWIAGGLLWVWDDDGPRSMAARAGETPHGARVGAVYTPRAHRGRGYGQAVTTAVTASILASGKRFAFLYTDAANPTSNAIYARIGYRVVADSVERTFT